MKDATDQTTVSSVMLHEAHGEDGRAAYVDAMAQAVTGVTVVTTDGPAGRVGQTVSAICSVSADPPMVLACVHERSPLAEAIAGNRVFAVNVLTAGHALVADTFAGRAAAGERYDFGCAQWGVGETGSPLLCDAVATFDCALHAEHDGSSHAIFVGAVLRSARLAGQPLVYAGRTYGRLLPLAA